MDKKKIQIYITVCLIIILVWFVANGARTMRPVIARSPLLKHQRVTKQSPSEEIASLPLTAHNDKPRGGFGRDPFSRQAAVEDLSLSTVSAREGDINGIVLTGIVYDAENSAENYCIINSEVVKLGESVAGFTLTGIKEDSVILTSEKEGKDYALGLWDDGS